jgi:Tfp pilus assembly protein PilF
MPVAPRPLLALLLLCAPVMLPAQGSIKLPKSLSELEKIVKSDSNDHFNHYNVALAYWNARRWDDVDRELRAALALEPRFAEAHLALAYLPVARNQKLAEAEGVKGKEPPKEVKDAIEQFNREYRHAFLINPLVDMRIMAVTDRSPDYFLMQQVFGEVFADYIGGLADCEEGRYGDCEARLTSVVDRIPRSVPPNNKVPDNVYWHRGIAAAHMSHFDIASADFGILIDRDAERVKAAEGKGLIRSPLRTNEYRYFRAVIEHAAGHDDAAVDLLHTVIENDLGQYIAHVRLADIYEARRLYDKALEERRSAINVNPEDASLNLDLGITLGKAGKFAEAEEALMAATRGVPRNAEAWFWLGLAREQLGKKADARAAYERVVAIAPARLQGRVAQARQHLAALQ